MGPEQYRPEFWLDPRVDVRASPIQGKGLFAREPFEAGETVEIIGGQVMTQNEFDAFVGTGVRFNAVQIGEETHLVEQPDVTAAREGSLNHCCDSNLWMQDEVTLMARGPIAADEELTVDYALFTASPDWVLEGPCRCGRPLCRRTVTGNDWQRAEVQERYRGHFSPFLNARIARRRMEGR